MYILCHSIGIVPIREIKWIIFNCAIEVQFHFS